MNQDRLSLLWSFYLNLPPRFSDFSCDPLISVRKFLVCVWYMCIYVCLWVWTCMPQETFRSWFFILSCLRWGLSHCFCDYIVYFRCSGKTSCFCLPCVWRRAGTAGVCCHSCLWCGLWVKLRPSGLCSTCFCPWEPASAPALLFLYTQLDLFLFSLDCQVFSSTLGSHTFLVRCHSRKDLLLWHPLSAEAPSINPPI